MKKLSKLKLHNATLLNDREMKSIVGGYGGYDGGGYGGGGYDGYAGETETCGKNANGTCSGTCNDAQVWNPITKTNETVSCSCKPLGNGCVCG